MKEKKGRLFVYRTMHFFLKGFARLDRKIVSKIERLKKETQTVSAEKFANAFLEQDSFFQDITVITHAGGGLQGLDYLNCVEAFPYYYQKGNRVFEYDVVDFGDGKFLCSHEENVSSADSIQKIDDRFSPMLLETCLDNLVQNADVTVVFDCKIKNLEKFAAYVKSYVQNESVLNRIVIQVFNETNIQEIQKIYPYKMLYVCMNNTDYVQTAKQCLQYGIRAVSVSYNAIQNRVGWDIFAKNNICTFAYTVNTKRQFADLKTKGITGIFSDFLLEKDVKE